MALSLLMDFINSGSGILLSLVVPSGSVLSNEVEADFSTGSGARFSTASCDFLDEKEKISFSLCTIVVELRRKGYNKNYYSKIRFWQVCSVQFRSVPFSSFYTTINFLRGKKNSGVYIFTKKKAPFTEFSVRNFSSHHQFSQIRRRISDIGGSFLYG
ncbi:hypothetical protein Barb4_04891 [Bacteroidales bacterium Barb4]|nr:hypothetical protein Barb4_04891 [Bacteroidales bacterium Barb4]